MRRVSGGTVIVRFWNGRPADEIVSSQILGLAVINRKGEDSTKTECIDVVKFQCMQNI